MWLERDDSIDVIVLTVLTVAVGFDCKTYRIPNWLVIPFMGTGLCYSGLMEGLPGLLPSFFGILLPILGMLPLHRYRMLGAGDIKLFAAIGSFIGLSVWKVILLSLLVGGILAIVRMLVSHTLVERMQHFLQYVLSVIHSGHMIPYESGFEEGKHENTIHFAIAIWIGYVLWLLKVGDYLL